MGSSQNPHAWEGNPPEDGISQPRRISLRGKGSEPDTSLGVLHKKNEPPTGLAVKTKGSSGELEGCRKPTHPS